MSEHHEGFMDRLSAHLDRGWELVTQGDLNGAMASAEQTLELDGDSPLLPACLDSVDEEVRIVHMGDYDACPCIDNHVASTKTIGVFRITTTSYDRSVLRIRYKLSRPDRASNA